MIKEHFCSYLVSLHERTKGVLEKCVKQRFKEVMGYDALLGKLQGSVKIETVV